MDISTMGTVLAIVVITYLIGLGAKLCPKIKDNVIPVIVGVTGGILGAVGMYVIPDFPAQDIMNAVGSGCKTDQKGKRIMIALQANKQSMKYLIPGKTEPVYETDDDGNIKYIIVDGRQEPIATGEYRITAGEIVDFRANINSTLTEAFIRAFGVDDSSDKATIVSTKNFLPLKDGMKIWKDSEVLYKNETVDENSADYEVIDVNTEALNEDCFLLKKLLHNGGD